MQLLGKITDLVLNPKPSSPLHGGGVSDVNPLHRVFMKPLGALYTHAYTHFCLLLGADTQLFSKYPRKQLEHDVFMPILNDMGAHHRGTSAKK